MNLMKPTHNDESSGQNPMHAMDGSALKRPFDPPRYVIAVCVVAAVAAFVVGGFLGGKAIDQILHGDERAAATVAENIARDVSYNLPNMQSYIGLDDASILNSFAEAGYLLYDLTTDGEDGIDTMKLPDDTSLSDAAITLGAGISNMDAVAASKYLVGSWRFTVDRGDVVSMRVRYCDLRSSDASAAIIAALESQGWNGNADVTITGEGVDEVGNTYKEGTLPGGATWRISACDLSAVYDIAGLPETAQYVGIRVYS